MEFQQENIMKTNRAFKGLIERNFFVPIFMSFLMVCSVTVLMPAASADNGSAVTTRINSGTMPVATIPVKQQAGGKAVTQFTSNTIATSPKVSRASQDSDNETHEITATVERLPNNNVAVTGRITGNVPTRRPFFTCKNLFSK